MHTSHTRTLVVLLALASASGAAAQTATFNVDAAGQVTTPDASLSGSKTLTGKTPISIAVQCADKGCKQVTTTVEGAKVDGVVTDVSATFAIKKEHVTTDPAAIVVSRSANAGGSFAFKFDSTGDAADKPADTGGSGQLTFSKEYAKCTSVPDNTTFEKVSDTARKAGEAVGDSKIEGLLSLFNRLKPRVAVFIVLPNGSVLQRPVDVDEGQVVVVAVRASDTIIGDIVVKRTSAIRTPDVFRAIGAEVDISKLALQSLADGEPETCVFHYAVLGDDFAPGTGSFEIRSFTAQKAIGSVDFGVDALYSGIYSLGALRSKAIDPDFYLSSDGMTQTVRQRNLGDHDVLYSVMYTPFIWSKRSLQRRPPFWQWFNPTMGVVLDDVSDNFLAGVSLDLPVGGMVITYGKHYRKVSRLDPASGLTPGSPFAGTIEQLPVGKEWDDEKFLALTIDLRAAVTLIQKGLRTAPN